MNIKACKMIQIFSVISLLIFHHQRGENVTVTLQRRLLSENSSHSERVAASQIEKENDNSKSILTDKNCLFTYSLTW